MVITLSTCTVLFANKMGKVDYTFDDLVEITEWSLEQSPGSACRSNVLENWRRNQRLKLIIDEFVATIHCNNHYTAILHEGMQESDADRTVSISPQTVTDCWYLGEHGCTHATNATDTDSRHHRHPIDNNDVVQVTDRHTKRSACCGVSRTSRTKRPRLR